MPRHIKSKWSYNDFLYMHMQKMDIKKIETFLTDEELVAAEKKLNDDAYRKYFNNKLLFYERFGSFMKRDVISLRDITENYLLSFVKKHKRVALKPVDKYAGIGFSTAYADRVGNVIFSKDTPSFEEMQKQLYIAEDYVYQHKAYSDVYPKSLNTLRVTTYIDSDGKPDILFVVNQFGSEGSITDNDDIKGIWCVTDKETGIIKVCEEDEKNGFVYDTHPDTNIKFSGFQNPYFEEVKKTALRAALVVPKCRLVGWDIAVREDGEIVIIEGNVTPELSMYQRLSGDGLKRIAKM